MNRQSLRLIGPVEQATNDGSIGTGPDRNAPDPAPYTADSIARAKAFQQSVRLQTALELGIPRDLVALYDVFGYERVAEWTRVLLMLREP